MAKTLRREAAVWRTDAEGTSGGSRRRFLKMTTVPCCFHLDSSVGLEVPKYPRICAPCIGAYAGGLHSDDNQQADCEAFRQVSACWDVDATIHQYISLPFLIAILLADAVRRNVHNLRVPAFSSPLHHKAENL